MPSDQVDAANTGPRRRILDAAAELFYRRGLHASGVDALIAAARVAKASFYHHFPTKDALMAEYVRERDAEFGSFLAGRLGAAPGKGPERLLSIVDAVDAWAARDGFVGCPLMAVLEELPDGEHPARRAAEDAKAGHRALLRAEAAGAGAADPDAVAEVLAMLIDGVLLAGRLGRRAEAAAAARAAMIAMIDRPRSDTRSDERARVTSAARPS